VTVSVRAVRALPACPRPCQFCDGRSRSRRASASGRRRRGPARDRPGCRAGSASTPVGVSAKDREGRRGPPQDVRAGGEYIAGQGVGLEVAVGQHQHPRPERRQQVSCQGLLHRACRARRWPRPAPRSPTPPRGASGPAETPRPGSRSRVGRSTRCSRWCPARRWWCRPSTPPAARSRTPPRRRPGLSKGTDTRRVAARST
jgi:hypothetical protein